MIVDPVHNMYYSTVILLLALAAMIQSQETNNLSKCDDGIVLKGIKYEKEIIKENLKYPYMLSVDYNNRFLFFTFTESYDIDPIYGTGYINLETKDFTPISGVSGAYSTTVDPDTHKAYIGGGDGIYEVDYQEKTATNMNITDKNIWQVYANDGIYFTTYPEEEMFVYKNGKTSRVAEIDNAKVVAFDKDDNMFFSNTSGLYCFKKNDAEISYIGNYTVRAFTNDANGKLFFSTDPDGIYEIENLEIKKLIDFEDIAGLAIDNDGSIIYLWSNAIYRLKSTGIECNESDKQSV